MAFEQNEGRKQAKWISGGSVSRQGDGKRKGQEVARRLVNLRNSKEPVGLEPGV